MAGADVARIAFAQREYRTVTSEDLTVQARHPLAVELEYSTLISTVADAKVFGDYVLDLRKQDRDTWSCTVNKANYSLEIGDTVTIAYPRFGLGLGGDFIVKGIKRDSASLYDQLVLYGPRTYGDFGVGPRDTLNFTQANLPTGASVVRAAAIGEYHGPQGTLVTAPADTPRIAYNPTTLTVAGLLVEPSRQNSARNSEVLSDGTIWVVSGVTVNVNADVAPDGSTTAEKLTLGVASGTYKGARLTTGTLAASTRVVFSYYVKAAGVQYIQLSSGSTTIGTCYANVDIVNGVVTQAVAGTNPQFNYGVEPAGNGWYRVWYSAVTLASGTLRLEISPVPNSNSSRGVTWAGDGASAMLVWGAQLELGATPYSGPSSYVMTTSAAVVRAAETLNVNWGARGYPDGPIKTRLTFSDGTTADVGASVLNGIAGYTGLNFSPLTSMVVL